MNYRTVSVSPAIRLSRRLRFRIWRERMAYRLRYGKQALEFRDDLGRRLQRDMDRALLFGEGK